MNPNASQQVNELTDPICKVPNGAEGRGGKRKEAKSERQGGNMTCFRAPRY